MWKTIILVLAISSVCSTKIKVDDLFDGLYEKDIYSGYLKTDIEGNELFYLFTPSQSENPLNDPVLLWLNGGPGCSSLSGFLDEHGCVLSELYSDKLEYNKYSWNLNANVIYIEAPAGVGFSKSKDLSQKFDDTMTAKGTHQALKNFFIEYPEYVNNDFYISGESYAGVYIPFLARSIITEEGNTINLKGLLIGNGLTDFEMDLNNAMVEVGYYHSLISLEIFNAFLRNCPHMDPEVNYPPPRNVTKRCNEVRKAIQESYDGLDVYGMYRICPALEKGEPRPFTQREALLGTAKKIKEKRYADYIQKHPEYYYEPIENEEYEEEIELWPSGCKEDMTANLFLNSEKTKEKLGVDKSMKWEQCSGKVYEGYQHSESFDFYSTFMKEHPELRVWFFSGETDMAVPLIGSIRWMNKLNLNVTTKYQQWHTQGQVAGHYLQYESGLVFVSVKGAGHMVPQDKKPESKVLLDAFLSGTLPK